MHGTTYADLVIEYINQLGVDYVFGVPGGAIEPLVNALAKSERIGGPKFVVARHETGAAFMADGYYRETGKLGVVCSTTGPGATNLITGVSSAMADEVPLLVLTAQTPLPKFGKRALQESSCTAIDTVSMFRHCTRFTSLISHCEQLETKLVSAIMAAYRKPQGPVHLSIPSDVLRMPCNVKVSIRPHMLEQQFALHDDPAITKLCTELAKAKSIALYLGDGVYEAHNEIMEFIHITSAPFVTGPVSKRWVNEKHHLYRGVYGFAGHASAKELIQNKKLDLVLAVGAAMGELETAGWNHDLLNDKLVHIDSSVEHFTRSSMAMLHVCGNLNTIFQRLLDHLREAQRWGREWHTIPGNRYPNILGSYVSIVESEKCLSDASPIKPQRLMKFLSDKLPSNTRIFVDAGNSWAWATHYLLTNNNEGHYRVAMGFGSMAWAIGASVGSALGGGQPTLCIVGDGSYLMSAQEITVASQLNLPVVFLVLNDAAMGMVMHGQRLGGAEEIGWELNTIDYASMASSMGADGVGISTVKKLEDISFEKLFDGEGPTLLDVKIDREEVPPMTDRVKGLAVNSEFVTVGG